MHSQVSWSYSPKGVRDSFQRLGQLGCTEVRIFVTSMMISDTREPNSSLGVLFLEGRLAP